MSTQERFQLKIPKFVCGASISKKKRKVKKHKLVIRVPGTNAL